MNMTDGLAKLIIDDKQKAMMLSAKTDRHEKWIKQLSKKTDLKLEY